MNRKIRYVLIIAIFMLLFPTFSNALSWDSGLISRKESATDGNIEKLVIGNISFSTYSKVYGVGKDAYWIDFNISNIYATEVDANITIKLFDEYKTLLLETKESIQVPKASSYNYDKMTYLESNQKANGNNIKYYQIHIDVLTDLAEDYNTINETYYVGNYNLDVDVKVNNTFLVNEKYDVVVKGGNPVITRAIPFRHEYTRVDGTKVNKRAVINDLKVNGAYSTDVVDAKKILKFKDKVESVELSYNYGVGKDTLKNKDEFYYCINCNFDVKIYGINFSIKFPKMIDSNNVFVIDRDGNVVDNEKLTYTVENSTVKGVITNSTRPGENYYVRVLLPDNYFVNTKYNISLLSVLTLVVPSIFLVIAILSWLYIKKCYLNKNDKEIYPFGSVNSLDVGYYYHGKVRENDITSLLFYLAQKGYIKIKENSKGYKICKGQKYTLSNEVERKFLDELFDGRVILNRKDLINCIGYVDDEVIRAFNKSKKEILLPKVFNYKLLYWLMIIITIVLNILNYLVEFNTSVIVLNVLLNVVGYIMILTNITRNSKLIEKIIISLIGLMFIICPIVFTSYRGIVIDNLYIITFMICVLFMIMISVVISLLPNRNRFGMKKLREVKSYRDNMLSLTEEEIRREYKRNHDCLYTLLPNAFVFGISDRWMDKFKNINLNKPKWYDCEGEFDRDKFYETITRIYSDMYFGFKSNKK